MAIASLILGIVGIIVSFFVPFPISIIGLILSIVGIVLGALARKKAKAAGEPAGLATAGMVISIISVVLSAIGVIACGACVALGAGALASLGAM